MRVTILGCGASEGVPVITGNWGECDPKNPKNRRTRASIAVEKNGTTLLVDTSPDLRFQWLSAKLSRPDAVLYTHDHADHTHGISDLRAFTYFNKIPIPIYADPHTLEVIKGRFDYAFPSEELRPDIYHAFVTANVIDGKVLLNWQTATEVNNYGFEVERVKGFGDKVSMVSVWSKVGFVNGAGNSNSPKEYSFTDKSAASGRYLYRLKQLDNDGQYTYSKEVEVDLGTPTAFALEQNYPNPFNPTTSMQYSVSNKQFVTIKVFDMLGREVALLVNGEKEPVTYTTEFATTGLASGTYIYRMQAGEFVQTKKMVILK